MGCNSTSPPCDIWRKMNCGYLEIKKEKEWGWGWGGRFNIPPSLKGLGEGK